MTNASSATDNVLLQPWQGPFGGVPPFSRVKIEDFKPAMEMAMAESLAAIDAITGNAEAPSFANTIEPLEKSDRRYTKVMAVYNVWAGSMSSDAFRPVQVEMAPKLAAYRDRILQNAALFQRIEAIYESKQMETLNPEQQRLVWDYYTNFVRAGAKLSVEQKQKVGDINQRLAALYTKFSNNLLHDEEEYALYLTKDQLGGLPDQYIASAAEAASARGRKGEYAVLNTRSSMDPFLTFSTERALREKVWRTYYSRGDNNDAYDNKPLITEILKLRAERTQLQGYPSFAHRAIEK
ncbi:MAG: M3 family metallopeptidase, partial [Bryobacterales bacterium]|nr:M3 family metallopeptidase [Bryobacterales bacterium]